MEEKPKNYKLCDICKSEAIFICLECMSNYYCESCYKLIHDKKVNSNHKKENIDYFFPIETKCIEHPNNKLDLFCIEERGKHYIFE